MVTKADIIKGFETGVLPLAAVLFVCVFSLAAALVAQYVFGLAPCILCIYQRWPFVVVGLLAMLGLFLRPMRSRAGVLFLSAIAFAVNCGIAIFHVGVEQKWWKGTDACHLPDLSQATSTEEFMAMLEAAPTTPCDQIPWEFMGLSMAGMNVILCFAMAIFCLGASVFLVRKANGL